MNNRIRFHKTKWVLLVSVIAAVIIGFAASSQIATGRPQEDGTLILSVEDEVSGVSYLIGVDNLAHEVNAEVEYDNSTANGIERYRAFNNRELVRILKEIDPVESIPVKITFKSPLNEEEFTKFVKLHEIEVENYIIYMLESDGRVVTIQGSPSDTELVPTKFFDIATNSISREYNSGAGFLGWVEVRGLVRAERVAQIGNASHVFLVDVMELFLESKLTDETLANAGIDKGYREELIANGLSNVYQKPIAWGLYHLDTQ